MICAVKDNFLIFPCDLNLPQRAVLLFVGDTIKLYTLRAWDEVCEKAHSIEDKNKRNMALRILFSTSKEIDIVDGSLKIPKRHATDGEGKITVQSDFVLIEGIVWNGTISEEYEY